MAETLTERGNHVSYRGAGTQCPGCGRSQWLVGRIMAECAFCGTALPLEADQRGTGGTIIKHRKAGHAERIGRN